MNGHLGRQGQVLVVPLHVRFAAQTLPFASTWSRGHVVDAPVQDSATSHGPDAARHFVPAEAVAWTHFAPSQRSNVHAFLSSQSRIVRTKVLMGVFARHTTAASVQLDPLLLTKLVPGTATTFDEYPEKGYSSGT